MNNLSNFYLNARPGGDTLFKKQTSVDTLINGDLNRYATGIFVTVDNTKRIFQHGGATAEYRAKLVSLPDAGISVGWLGNTSMLDTTGKELAMDVATFLASPSYFELAAKTKRITYSDSNINELKAYAGLYKSSHRKREVQIELRPYGLEMSGNALTRINKHNLIFTAYYFPSSIMANLPSFRLPQSRCIIT
jgi:hypothetical protein